jgi:O-antigen/teichoic acid export membrane protein
MSQIRKKSLISASWIYIGFLIGALNTFLFTTNGLFTPEDYGLSRSLQDIGFLLSACSAFGTYTLLLKFHPYYQKRLPAAENDLFSIAVIVAGIGFLVIAAITFFLEPIIVRKFNANAPALLHYFYWSLFLALGVLFYTLLEYHAWNFGQQVQTNILKEVVLRLFVLVLLLLKISGVLSPHFFFIGFCFQYIFIASLLFWQLYQANRIKLVFKVSSVTKKFGQQIKVFMLYGIAGSVAGALRIAIDSIVLASIKGLSFAGVYTLASYAASLLQAPYRSLVSVTLPLLSTAWKEKNLKEIDRIYKRSSINLLIFSLLLFGIIFLGFEPAIRLLHLNNQYVSGKQVLLLLSMANMIEMGTGVNGQIISTSTAWRFEFYTNVLLGILITALSFVLTKYTSAGTAGPAWATLIGLFIYNAVRIVFLQKKYNLFPFTGKTLWAVFFFALSAIPAWWLQYYYPSVLVSLIAMLLFAVVFTGLVVAGKITPDIQPVVENVLKRLSGGRKE